MSPRGHAGDKNSPPMTFKQGYSPLMASVETRTRKDGSQGFGVVWRDEHGKQSETFATLKDANGFRDSVNAAGNEWPQGWTPGLGYAGTFTPAQPKPAKAAMNTVVKAQVWRLARSVCAAFFVRWAPLELAR